MSSKKLQLQLEKVQHFIKALTSKLRIIKKNIRSLIVFFFFLVKKLDSFLLPLELCFLCWFSDMSSSFLLYSVSTCIYWRVRVDLAFYEREIKCSVLLFIITFNREFPCIILHFWTQFRRYHLLVLAVLFQRRQTQTQTHFDWSWFLPPVASACSLCPGRPRFFSFLLMY